MAIETRTEGKRGCGYRKPGGTYLVSGGAGRPCGKLPLALERCPTCDHGVKFARGWTWVDADALLASKTCALSDLEKSECSTCPLGLGQIKMIGRAGLLWIGEKFYKTPADWFAETEKMGVSRRIQTVPREFELGKTWVLVAHIKAISKPCVVCEGRCWIIEEPTNPEEARTRCGVCKGEGVTYTPGIFQMFKPTAVEYVVKGDETLEEIEALEKRGIVCVKVEHAEGEEEEGEDNGEAEDAA